MSGKFALIIGNTEYIDPGLSQLTAPGKDAEDFARVLSDQKICAFDYVNIILNESESMVRGAIDEFFEQKKPDDLAILYFSGHGIRDELGALYLAVKNTNKFRLRSTAIKSDFIREVMDQSRSKRQVLILDCCNSGAFTQGTKTATGISIGTSIAFESGYGRIILTASDSTQFAWEGDKVIGKTDNSLFTHFLVEGLKGKADLDGDGRITVDELYDFTYEQVKQSTSKQTPSKFSNRQQGEIVLRQNIRSTRRKTNNRSISSYLTTDKKLSTSSDSTTDKRLSTEYRYIVGIAMAANKQQNYSFYLIAMGSLIAALFGTQLFDADKFTQAVKVMFSGLFVLLTLLGTSTIMQLARLRGAWYEAMLGMNQIKDFAMKLNPELIDAFRWTKDTLPPKFKTRSVSYFQAIEVSLISGFMFGVAIFFLQQAFFDIILMNWILSGLFGLFTVYIQLTIYRRVLN